MKRKRRLNRRGLFAALVAAILMVVLLSTCGSGGGQDPGDSSSGEETTDTTDTAGAPEDSAQETGASQEAPDPERPALPEDFLQVEEIEITSEDGEEISRVAGEMERAYRAGPDSPVVERRDWNIYTSALAKKGMTAGEAAFYDRLTQLCQRYIENPALNGVEHVFSGNRVRYAADRVNYGDLSLTKKRAAEICWWFKYNNPQYYFLSDVLLSNKDCLIPTLYEFAANGEARAKYTNELFGKLDLWLEALRREAGTVWQMELLANNLLCREFSYDYSLTKDDAPDVWRGQNIYSAVMTGKTVCAGYAQTFAAMMNASGVETVVALSPNHAWNVVHFQDGNYYAMDVCWNDNEKDALKPYNRYFNAGEVTLKARDTKEASHAYREDTGPWTPVISKKDYAPTAYDKAKKPAAPANVAITKDGDKITITWDPVAGASGYQEVWFTDGTYQTEFGEIMAFDADHTSTVWKEMENGMTYYHGVRAVKTVDGRELYSDWVTSAYTHAAVPSEITPDLFFDP